MLTLVMSGAGVEGRRARCRGSLAQAPCLVHTEGRRDLHDPRGANSRGRAQGQ